MTLLEQIRTEVKRLMHQASDMNQYGLLTKEQEVCILSQMSRLLSFLDTLQKQEHPIDANKMMDEAILAVDIPDDAYNSYDHQNIIDACKKLRAIAFKAGAEFELKRYAKLKELADNMYNAAFYLTTDASRLHKAMEEYKHYVNFEMNK